MTESPKTELSKRTDEVDSKVNAQAHTGAEEPVVAKADDTIESSSAVKSSVKVKPKGKNNVRKLRMERMMSKAELARRAGLSTLTIDRVERGMTCRMDTKRKILEALGLTPSDRVTVFGDDD